MGYIIILILMSSGIWDADTEVNGIRVAIIVVARVNLEGVDLDDSPILGTTLFAAARGRTDILSSPPCVSEKLALFLSLRK